MGFFQEIRRRRVIQVGIGYLVVAWLLVQVAVAVEAPLALPVWVDTLVIVLLAIGFPVALVLTWGFQTTAQPSPDDEAHGEPNDLLSRSVTTEAKGDVGGSQRDVSNWVAVLPFENLSPDPNDAYFAAGIHEEILNQLAKIRELSVIARTSVLRYRNTDRPIREIAEDLGVGAVIEGSVRYSGDRVRVTAQLIDAASGAHLWSEAYDRHMEDVFAIQTDIAVSIADSLKVELSVAEQEAINVRPTDNLEAYACYLSAITGWSVGRPVNRAHEQLEKAKALDPNFARAFALSASFYGTELSVMFPGLPRTRSFLEETAVKALHDAEKALAINPDEPLAHYALACVHVYNWDWDDAYREGDLALELGPDTPLILQCAANTMIWRGRHDEGVRFAKRAADIDPRNFTMRLLYGARLSQAGRYEEALAVARNVRSDFPDRGLLIWGIAFNELELGNTAAAAQESLELTQAIDERATVAELGAIAFVLGMSGETEEVKSLADQLGQRELAEHIPAFVWYQTLVGLGDLDAALDYLNRAVDERDDTIWMLPILRWQPESFWWDPVRNHPRFVEARRKMGADD